MTIAVAALGVLVGIFIGLGIAWLIVRKWERQIQIQVEPLEPLDDSYRRLSTHVRSVSDQRWVRWMPRRVKLKMFFLAACIAASGFIEGSL